MPEMNSSQLNHYRGLPSVATKADYLVRIGQARTFSEAMSQIGRRSAEMRRARNGNKPKVEQAVQLTGVARAYFE